MPEKNPNFPGALSPSLRDISKSTNSESNMAVHTSAIHNRLRREAAENGLFRNQSALIRFWSCPEWISDRRM